MEGRSSRVCKFLSYYINGSVTITILLVTCNQQIHLSGYETKPAALFPSPARLSVLHNVCGEPGKEATYLYHFHSRLGYRIGYIVCEHADGFA